MAEYLHARDTRRVINALVKYFKYMGNHKESEVVSSGGSGLRYYPILIWMRASPEILEQRIAKRIDQMIDDQGGLEEIRQVFEFYHSLHETLDFEKGILQAIGYKEFYPVYQLLREEKTPSEEDLIQAKLRLKQKTIDYTKYQIKWLQKRVGSVFPTGQYLLVIELDDPKLYEEVALNKGLELYIEHVQSSMERY
jgi:tRNA A37 N6-isopentenylltransferase MiaA